MSLFTQKNTDKTLRIFIYVFTGGIASLLMLFLARQSLPINRKETNNYYKEIQELQQDIYRLQKNILQLFYSSNISTSNIDIQLENTNDSFRRLQNIPSSLSKKDRDVLINKLEAQKFFLESQINSIEQIQDLKINLAKSCGYIPKLRSDLNYKSDKLSQELKFSLTNLLDNITLYCYQQDKVVMLTIEGQLRKFSTPIDQDIFTEQHFLVKDAVERSHSIISSLKKIETEITQVKLSEVNQKLFEYENTYLEYVLRAEKKIYIYRLLSYLFVLVILIIVAQQIINHLVKTNRNIVKILEGFTQELETKVEQRTAQLEESIQNTEAALAQAQNANKAKSRFLANMSHELRTPLNAILGFTQLMCRDSSISPEHYENVQIINRSGEHLLKLINDILEMSKIEVGQITLNETKFDLFIMLKSIEDMLHLKAKAKNIELVFDIAKNIPQYIYTDEGKLRQILINLLGNALKFTERGEICLIVKLRENIPIEKTNIDFLFSDIYGLYFAIKDTGPGIPEEEMEQLFSPFEQTKVGRISNEGTGLGLSICQKFVELMGGELSVESIVGTGSLFFFEILIKVEDVNVAPVFENEAANETRRIAGIAPNQPEYKILAVDDVPASRLLLRKILTEIGFVVEEAGDGQQAIELFSSWNPDLILMDMRMPVIDGYEATEKIKSLPKGKETIIIALTASAFEEEKVVILSAGCDDFMRKPFYENDLLEKIGQYLNIDYLYEDLIEVKANKPAPSVELTPESLEVMSLEWRSQLYDAAARVDDREILQLLSDIPEEYESLAQGLESLVEHFRCDKIIDLTRSGN